MQRITPVLHALSTFFTAPAQASSQTRELDFNLARRSGIVINQIYGSLALLSSTTTGFDANGVLIQELDLDPDNLLVWEQGLGPFPGAVELDSSRVFRQHHGRSLDTAAGAVSQQDSTEFRDFTHLPEVERPISITNMRHHMELVSNINDVAYAQLSINYFIVELSLLELGIINASRR